MFQTRAVWSTEPDASFVPVQFQATECTFKHKKSPKTQSNIQPTPESNKNLGTFLSNLIPNLNNAEQRGCLNLPSSCGLGTRGWRGSWSRLLRPSPPSPLPHARAFLPLSLPHLPRRPLKKPPRGGTWSFSSSTAFGSISGTLRPTRFHKTDHDTSPLIICFNGPREDGNWAGLGNVPDHGPKKMMSTVS